MRMPSGTRPEPLGTNACVKPSRAAAVRRRPRGVFGGNGAAAARLRLDDDRLAQARAELVGDSAGNEIGRGAGSRGQNDGNRPGRKILGLGGTGGDKDSRGDKRRNTGRTH